MDRYFHLDDSDRSLINFRRGDHSRLGFAVQLCTARFLGTFLEDLSDVPSGVVNYVAKQLDINQMSCFLYYCSNDETRCDHAAEIRRHCGFHDFNDGPLQFRLNRWLYALCWTGTDRPGVLFDRATTWLITHKVMLPAVTTLERHVARLRARVDERLWMKLTSVAKPEAQAKLSSLLSVPEGGHQSLLNPKYFGYERGVTYYNLISDQFTGLNAIVVPGTLRDSLSLLSVVLEQQTELNPTEIMTDTGAYTDVVFGLFWLLGYRFCPRIADIGGTRYWRIDPLEDYGLLNGIARHWINTRLIEEHWDDMLRLAGSLKLGVVQATAVMRTLQIGDRPTKLAQAFAELGRIDKTIHALTYIDDENKRRRTLTQLNRGEDRHKLARAIFHGRRGELRQRYREGQEDQLGALGLVVNVIILWNTLYINAALEQLEAERYPVRSEDVARLSPLVFDHINLLGRYAFSVPDSVIRGELRPLRNPADVLEDVA